MKKRLLVMSALAALVGASVVMGGTYALFTSEANTNIAVTAGKVSVNATIGELSLYSPKVIGLDGAIEDDENVAAANTFANGGTASIEDGKLSLNNIAPGDKVAFKISVANQSNIAAKMRIGFETTDEDLTLLAGLKVKMNDTDLTGIKSYKSGWELAENKEYSFEIELPATAGNIFKGKSISFIFSAFAVQGNANVTDEEEMVDAGIVVVNPTTINDFLFGKLGSTSNKTVLMEDGTYEKLNLAVPTKYEGSNTTYTCQQGTNHTDKVEFTDADEFIAHINDGKWHGSKLYSVTMENTKFIAAGENVTVEGIQATSGHSHASSGSITDYVVDKTYTSGSVYYSGMNLKDISFNGIKFTKQCSISSSDTTVGTKVDGIKFTECEFDEGSIASTVGAAIRFYSENMPNELTSIGGLEVTNCKFTNVYQGVYAMQAASVTLVGNTVDNTGHNAFAFQSSSGKTFGGTVVVENNVITNCGDRAIRFGDVKNANITIKNNSASYRDGDNVEDCMKASSIVDSVIVVSGNNWNNYKAAANSELAEQ